MDKYHSLIKQIKDISSSNLAKEEKWAKTLELARELGRIILEEKSNSQNAMVN